MSTEERLIAAAQVLSVCASRLRNHGSLMEADLVAELRASLADVEVVIDEAWPPEPHLTRLVDSVPGLIIQKEGPR